MMVNSPSRYIRTVWIFLFFSLHTRAFPQDNSECNLKFIDHLVNKGCYEEALFLLDSGDCSLNPLNDSINYLRGWSLYSMNQLVMSSENFLKITPASSFYLKSQFYAAYNLAQTGYYDKAIEVLDKIEFKSDSLILLRSYQIAGIRLLQGDILTFEEWFRKTDKGQPGISGLLSTSIEIKNHRSKSPFIAGFMSGIIPGSGKFYAGKKGEAISVFLSTVGLGLVTWENYRKNGPKNYKTIVFGSLFAVTYIANIYGSVFTVRIMGTDYKENVKSTILFNLHIPLLTAFGK